jgi:hypothetical protein
MIILQTLDQRRNRQRVGDFGERLSGFESAPFVGRPEGSEKVRNSRRAVCHKFPARPLAFDRLWRREIFDQQANVGTSGLTGQRIR